MESRIGRSSARARASASSPQGYQSTGLRECCRRYGLVSPASRFSRFALMNPFPFRPGRASPMARIIDAFPEAVKLPVAFDSPRSLKQNDPTMPIQRWLLKTEPSVYSFEDLVAKGRERWDGITN